MSNERPDLIDDILNAPAAKDVKEISKGISCIAVDWDEDEKDQVMEQIVREKLRQVLGVKEALLDTKDRIMAEAVQSDVYWSCGLTKDAARVTDPAKWPGQNRLGKLWMKLRQELQEDGC